ncbi:hypothetical protein EK904_009706 [Melospiza melodia maxima]|nr:hypothetical protein EK904_009706 [Melospiza melodia maxima]
MDSWLPECQFLEAVRVNPTAVAFQQPDQYKLEAVCSCMCTLCICVSSFLSSKHHYTLKHYRTSSKINNLSYDKVFESLLPIAEMEIVYSYVPPFSLLLSVLSEGAKEITVEMTGGLFSVPVCCGDQHEDVLETVMIAWKPYRQLSFSFCSQLFQCQCLCFQGKAASQCMWHLQNGLLVPKLLNIKLQGNVRPGKNSLSVKCQEPLNVKSTPSKKVEFDLSGSAPTCMSQEFTEVIYRQEGCGGRLQTSSEPARCDSSSKLLTVGNVEGRQHRAALAPFITDKVFHQTVSMDSNHKKLQAATFPASNSFLYAHIYSSSRAWPISRNWTTHAMRHRCDCEEDLNRDFCAKVALGPGSCWQCENLLSSALCLCQLGNGASDPMTPHMGKCVMKAKMWGLLEQHKALPCWERKAEDSTPAEFVIDSKTLPGELTVFYKRQGSEPSLKSLPLAKQEFGAASLLYLYIASKACHLVVMQLTKVFAMMFQQLKDEPVQMHKDNWRKIQDHVHHPRCRIGNEQEFKGRYGFVSAAAGMRTDGATAAQAEQSSLGQAHRAFLGRKGCSSGAVNPECWAGDWAHFHKRALSFSLHLSEFLQKPPSPFFKRPTDGAVCAGCSSLLRAPGTVLQESKRSSEKS